MFVTRIQSYRHSIPVPMRQYFLRWTIALPYLLRSHLRDYEPGADSIEELLLPEEVRSMLACGDAGSLSVTVCLPRVCVCVCVCVCVL